MKSFYAATETNNSSDEGFTSAEFNTLLEHKFNIIKSLILKLDDLQEQEKDEEPLFILCAFWGSYVLAGLEIPKYKTTSKPLWDLRI